jgi:UDP-N-acetylglucosamine--N-acetylmuramyl-(pentapeptide) pyrophosphoryl-undecaprenol N-acetylglucosamine transferase
MGDTQERCSVAGFKGLRLIIAGGGTGGHIFPGIAVGKELLNRYPASEVLFVTGGKQIESDLLSDAGFSRVSITVEGIKGRGLIKSLKAMIKLPYSLFQSLSIIKKFSPDLVLGVGGYSAGPVCLAARLMGKKTAIHEQNSFPGVTNRLLSRVVNRVFISFKESASRFPERKVRFTGNPIREGFMLEKEDFKQDTKGFTILVTGGSQGASAINDAVIGALKILKGRGTAPLIIHQTGQANFERVLQKYKENGLEGDVKAFIKDMPEAYRQADIFIGRAGAGTVFELAALGKPSILIPYPHAADDHQTANARMLSDIGGARIITQDKLSPARLAEVIIAFMDNRVSLKKMGEQARRAAKPDAAKAIADGIEEMIVNR